MQCVGDDQVNLYGRLGYYITSRDERRRENHRRQLLDV